MQFYLLLIQFCKADVVLLNYPLLWEMPKDVQRNDLEIYESITDPLGPAMTWGIFAINWMDLGEEFKAEEMFNKSYQSYAREPFHIWTEVSSGVGAVNFLTGVGGFLQTLIYGYAGLRIYPNYLLIKPRSFLPPQTSSMTLQGLKYLDVCFDLVIDQNEIKFKCGTHQQKLLMTIENNDGNFMQNNFCDENQGKRFHNTKSKVNYVFIFFQKVKLLWSRKI